MINVSYPGGVSFQWVGVVLATPKTKIIIVVVGMYLYPATSIK
jgi:hypothetical protein